MESKAISNSIHIFDCDGVLLDSNILKVEAMRRTLLHLGGTEEFVDWATETFSSNFGRTRREHFNVFSKNKSFKNYQLSIKNINKGIKFYGKEVVKLYKDCSVINETADYIKKLSNGSKIFVVSASDQIELRSILPAKISQLEELDIFGGPKSKVENLLNIMDKFKNKEIIFYGDSVQDAKASIESGVFFVGLTQYSADPKKLKNYCKLNNLLCLSNCHDVNFNE